MSEKKHRSTYVILITSYIAMAAIFTVLMAGVFLYSAGTLTGQIHETDSFTADRIVRAAGDELRNLYDQGKMLLQDDRLEIFAGLIPALRETVGNEMGKILDRANNFARLTTDLFFCLSGPDMILNENGFHEGSDLEALLQETLGITAEEWRERTAFPGERSFQVVTAGPDGEQHPRLLMMVRKPGNGEQACFIAGIVPAEMLTDIAAAMRPDGYEDIIVEYPEGIYSFSRRSFVTREELAAEEQSGDGFLSMLFSQKPIHVTTVEGNIDDWGCRIHFFCPMAPYRSIVLLCLRNFAVSVLVVLILGSVMLYYTLSKQYRPLKILMDRISGRRKNDDPALRREYRMLDQAISALQEKQRGTENRLAEYRTRLQETTVHQMLLGTDVREESLVEFFRQQELNLFAEQCCVLLLALDADEKMDGLDEAETNALLDILLDDLKNCVYRCQPDSCCIITDDCVECLICIDKNTDREKMLHALRESLLEYCRKNSMHFFAAVSGTETGTAGARQAYIQAESILDHVTMAGLRDVIMDEPPEQPAEQPAAQAKSGQEIRQQQLLDYVNTHYTDQTLSVLQMADTFDMSPSSVSRTFKQAANTGLNTYINTLRVSRAKELIASTEHPLKHISEIVGYGNQITMIRAFKKLEGVTPQEYRDMIRNGGKPEARPEE